MEGGRLGRGEGCPGRITPPSQCCKFLVHPLPWRRECLGVLLLESRAQSLSLLVMTPPCGPALRWVGHAPWKPTQTPALPECAGRSLKAASGSQTARE